MAVFSVWLPLLLQALMPLALLGWVAAYPFVARVSFGAAVACVALYILAIHLGGLWLVVPWYLPVIYWATLLVIAGRRWTGISSRLAPPASRQRLRATAAAGVGVTLIVIIVILLGARRPPGPPADVMFPLTDGEYLAVNAGGHVIVNAHLTTLEGDRYQPYRGQSYGIDLVRLNRVGLRAAGILPCDPSRYEIFGVPVHAPCDGNVIEARDGAPDMPPPQTDRAHMVGNYVVIDCDGLWIVLGHLQRGSVSIRTGDHVEVGRRLGVVGNSGNTGEPHLHIHAQRPGVPPAVFSGDPVPLRLNGRFLVRGQRVQGRGR